jgi:hypothetical protein
VLFWRLKRESFGGLAAVEASEKVERKPSRIGGWLLYLLSAYVIIQAAYSLISRRSAEKSWLGIVIAAGGMPFLAKAKLRIADQIQSRALRTDAVEALTCGYLVLVLLVGLLINAFVHWWCIDSLASLAIIRLLLREAKEAVSGSRCREWLSLSHWSSAVHLIGYQPSRNEKRDNSYFTFRWRNAHELRGC